MTIFKKCKGILLLVLYSEGPEVDDQEEEEEEEPRSNGELRPTPPQSSSGKGFEPTQWTNGILSGREREEDKEASLQPAASSDSTKQDSPEKNQKKIKVATVHVIHSCADGVTERG